VARRSNGEGTIYRRADGRYEAAALVHVAGGQRRRIRAYAATRADAQRLLLERLDRERRGIPAPVEQPSLGHYLDHWLEDIVAKTTRPLTLKSYEAIIRLYIKPLLGKKTLTRLSVQDVQQAIASLQNAGHSARTIQKFRANLRAALHSAMREELVFRNVASLAQIPKWERKEIKPWSLEEAARFLDATRQHRLHVAFLLLVVYGMREGEVLGLRWSDIDFAANTLVVRQQIQRLDGKLRAVPVKTSAGRRTLPLVPHVRTALLDLAAQRGVDLRTGTPLDVQSEFSTENLVVVSTAGGPIEAQNFLRTFRRACRDAGLRDIVIHHLRHTAATMLKTLGVPARDAQLILGHANVATTQQIYQHGDVEEQRKAVLAVQDALAKAPRERSAMSLTVSLPAPVGTRCRQELPSNDTQTMKPAKIQEPPLHETTGVDDLNMFGGATWIRTRDTRLFSSAPTPYALLPTPVITALQARSRRHILGLVAVNRCRQDTLDDVAESRLAELATQRQACQDALRDKLRVLCFPLNLLHATPLIDTKEAA